MRFEDISKKVKKFSKDTVEEMQKMNEIRQLNGRINDAKKQVNHLYVDMGKKLYDLYKEAPLEGFETEIRTIEEKLELVVTLQEEIRNVKGVVLCPCCNMEVALDERFCSNCGTKMPETFVIEEEDIVMDTNEYPYEEYEEEPLETGAETEGESDPAWEETEQAADVFGDETAEQAAEVFEEETAEQAAEVFGDETAEQAAEPFADEADEELAADAAQAVEEKVNEASVAEEGSKGAEE